MPSEAVNPSISPIQAKIKTYLNGSTHHIDEITRNLNMPVQVITANLLELELNNLVINKSGYYANKK